MKVTATDQSGLLSREYPYLGVHVYEPETIVLFNAPMSGVILRMGPQPGRFEPYKVAEVRTDWIESNFAQYHGIVTLSN